MSTALQTGTVRISRHDILASSSDLSHFYFLFYRPNAVAKWPSGPGVLRKMRNHTMGAVLVMVLAAVPFACACTAFSSLRLSELSTSTIVVPTAGKCVHNAYCLDLR